MHVLDWLLDSDPAIRWQVLRDLADVPEKIVAAERSRVANEGWGARLLGLQDEDGQWAGGALFPRGKWNRSEGQPWTATAYSLVYLHDFGVDPHDEKICRQQGGFGKTAGGSMPAKRFLVAKLSRASTGWWSCSASTLIKMSIESSRGS